MPHDVSREYLEALEDLLEQEHRFLMTGNLDGACRLVSRKLRLLDHPALQAPAHDTDPEPVRRIRHRAERNQALLSAAIDGVRAAMKQIEALRKGPAPLNTYGRDGRRLTLTSGGRGLERKA